jgi:hypothetical protein
MKVGLVILTDFGNKWLAVTCIASDALTLRITSEQKFLSVLLIFASYWWGSHAISFDLLEK